MNKMNIRFDSSGDGLIGCDVSAEGSFRRFCEIGLEVQSGQSPVEWDWSERVEQIEGQIICEAQSPGFHANLAIKNKGDFAQIDLTIKPRGEQTLNRCLLNVDLFPDGSVLSPSEELSVCNVPHLVPKPGLVMDDMIFRSPAIITRRGTLGMALLPDLDRLAESRPAPWIMDFDLNGPRGTARMSLGIMHYDPHFHVYFMGRPERSFKVPEDGLRLSGHLIVSGEVGDDFSRRVLKFLWDRYGIENYMSVKPQVMGFDELGKEAMARLFKRDDLYFEFDHNGKECAGVAAHAVTTKKQLRPLGALATKFISPMHGLFILTYIKIMNKVSDWTGAEDFIRRAIHSVGIPYIAESQFQSWFNNLRTAYGARALAERWGDDELKSQADRMKALALSAPAEDGIFAAVCTHPPGGKVHWKRGTLSFKAIDDYHTPDQATTGYVMLRWHRDIEPDPALLEKARGLGKFFIKHQRSNGAVPAWITGKTHRPMDRLLDTASTAGPMMFMAMLAKTDGDEEALESAERMAEFIREKVLPDHKWFDYETFFSCSRQRTPPIDPRTGVLPRNTMSMLWAAEGSRILFQLTGETKYRNLLLRCLDDLLFHQQVWNAPHLSINTFGGFGCMNTDAEWNDARQGIIAPVLMDSYIATGEPHYFQRGVAALRACYTTMLHPALKEVAPGNMVHYRESDRGAIYENYAHVGIDRVVAGYLEPDWGAGTAAFATAHALNFYGDIFIDLQQNHAFGINGCGVNGFETDGPLVKLKVHWPMGKPDDLKVVVRGAGPETKVLVNGQNVSFENYRQG